MGAALTNATQSGLAATHKARLIGDFVVRPKQRDLKSPAQAESLTPEWL
jgi:hypothetical protein